MAKADGKKKEEKKINAKQYLAEAGYVMQLINSDPSLQDFLVRVREYMRKNDNRVPTAYELDGLKKGIDWFERLNADQELARMQEADPRRKADFERSVVLREQGIQNIARNYGVELDPAFTRALALEARRDNLSEVEIESRLRPQLEAAVAAGEDLSGTAAEFEREIVQWASKNGLSLTGQTIARYVANGVEGRSTLDDIKNDLRRTYLAGSYPAWSDRIVDGADPYDIAQPYRERMAKLLELNDDQISFDDPLLQRGLQGIDSQGKPSVVPLYEFEKQIREDPRWQYTDNAYSTYTDVGTKLLSMFGFR